MPSRTPSPSHTGRDKHFPNKHDSHGSDSPQKKIVSYNKENEDEPGENGSKELPIFRGPDGGTIKYDIKELQKITVRIERSLPKQELRTIIDPTTIAPVRRPDEGKQPLFSRIAACPGTSSGEPATSSKAIERDKRKSRTRSPDYHSRSRKRSRSPSGKKRYHSPTPPHYRHSRHSPGRDSHEHRRSSRRTPSSERDRKLAHYSERDHEKRDRRRSVTRSPKRYRGRSSEDERERHHVKRRSVERRDRDRSPQSGSRDSHSHNSQRDRHYSHKNRIPEIIRAPHMLDPHHGMMPMAPMVMGPVVHPYPPFYPPIMGRPPLPGFRPYPPPAYRPPLFRPQRNPRAVPPRQPNTTSH